MGYGSSTGGTLLVPLPTDWQQIAIWTMEAPLRMLAVAAATGRIGYVFLVGGTLRLFELSVSASRSPHHAVQKMQEWIEYLEPDVIITEKITQRSRKSDDSHHLIEAITAIADDAPVNNAEVVRVQHFKNKYEEARAFAERFPQIKPWVPKMPPIWLPEPRNTIYFEALSLALEVIDPDWAPKTAQS